MVPHVFVSMIEAGTPLPAVRSKTFYTVSSGQEVVEVKIFQGENQDARENILLGDFKVEGLDPKAPSGSPVVIRMSLDLDGILHAQATEKNTGLSKDIRIENSLGKMSDMDLQQARRRMAEIFGTSIEGHDEIVDAELVDETSTTRDEYKEVIDLIERVEKMLDAMDEVDREDANTSIANLRQKMEDGEEPGNMKRDMEELEDLLFYLDTSE
jgi:molecular chaperone DnaK (HSP70)